MLRTILVFSFFSAVWSSEISGSFFGVTSNGGKPGIGIKLSTNHGIITGGSFVILSPEFPQNTSAQSCSFTNIVNENGQITAQYTVSESGRLRQESIKLTVLSQDANVISIEVEKTKLALNRERDQPYAARERTTTSLVLFFNLFVRPVTSMLDFND
jgi:hypothetical protein